MLLIWVEVVQYGFVPVPIHFLNNNGTESPIVKTEDDLKSEELIPILNSIYKGFNGVVENMGIPVYLLH